MDNNSAFETIMVETVGVPADVSGVQLNIQHPDTLQISAPACVGIFTGALPLPIQSTNVNTSIGCTFIGTTVSGTTGDVMTFVVTRIGDFTEPQLVTFDLVGDDRSRFSIAGNPVEAGTTNTLTVNPGEVVPDTTPPVLVLPDDLTKEATGPDGADVTFDEATATDDEDPSPLVECSASSGDTFPSGTTTVDCTATDSSDNTDTGSFDVTVEDTTPPDLTLPDDITEEATGPDGAEATFNPATATDLVDPEPVVDCSAGSGDTFPLGTTTVDCTATDASDNTSLGSFDVTVEDTTPPVLTVPEDLLFPGVTLPVAATDEAILAFLAAATAVDTVDPDPVVTVTDPDPLPSAFPLGATQVTFTATDASGNSAPGTASVVVGGVDLALELAPGAPDRIEDFAPNNAFDVLVKVDPNGLSPDQLVVVVKFDSDALGSTGPTSDLNGIFCSQTALDEITCGGTPDFGGTAPSDPVTLATLSFEALLVGPSTLNFATATSVTLAAQSVLGDLSPLTVAINDMVDVDLRVNLQIVTPGGTESFIASFFQDGELQFSRQLDDVATSDTTTYTLPLTGIPTDTYDIVVSTTDRGSGSDGRQHSNTLPNIVNGVVIDRSGLDPIFMGTLLEGNAVPSVQTGGEFTEIINALDLSLLVGALNADIYDARVDFNQDGSVGAADLALITLNYLAFRNIPGPLS